MRMQIRLLRELQSERKAAWQSSSLKNNFTTPVSQLALTLTLCLLNCFVCARSQIKQKSGSMPSAPASSSSTKRVGKYEVGRTLGEGTFGKVKAATDTETGEKVRASSSKTPLLHSPSLSPFPAPLTPLASPPFPSPARSQSRCSTRTRSRSRTWARRSRRRFVAATSQLPSRHRRLEATERLQLPPPAALAAEPARAPHGSSPRRHPRPRLLIPRRSRS